MWIGEDSLDVLDTVELEFVPGEQGFPSVWYRSQDVGARPVAVSRVVECLEKMLERARTI